MLSLMAYPRAATRLLVLALGLLAAAPACSGCGSDDDGSSKASGKPDASADGSAFDGQAGSSGDAGDASMDAAALQDVFDVWREAKALAEQSPDHLPARADELGASGDAAAILTLVQDHIATYPPDTASFAGALSRMRWGARATLRGGAGTPREKAELLRELYERAGFEAEVVRGDIDTTRATAEDLVLQATVRTFQPGPAVNADAWRTLLGITDPFPPVTVVDPMGTATAQLASSLATVLPAGATAPFDFTTLGPIPLVRVMMGGTWTFANPLVRGAALGDSVTTADPIPTGSPDSTERLRVRLEAARADDPFNRFLLVEGDWSAEEVVGRRLHVQFVPPAAADEFLTLTAGDVTTFVPVIALGGPDVDTQTRDDLSSIGKPFTRGGNLYEVRDSGEVLIDGQSLGTGNTSPADLARVDSLQLGIQPSAFRRVRLRIGALDTGGAGVAGLGADAFRVLEDGRPVPFTMLQNDSAGPRVLLLFDVSNSVPATFVGAGAASVANQIVDALFAQHPGIEARVGVVDFGVNYPSASWATTLTDAKAQADWLATLPTSPGSEIWEALNDANQADPDVVMLVTDGDATDTLEPKFKNAIAGGAPVIALGVGTVNQPNLDLVASLSGGLTTPIANQGEAVAAVTSYVGERAVEDYVLSYRAPATGPTTRNVTVRVDSGRVEVTGTYDVPADPAAPPALSGLYLTVRSGTREVTRTLAGYDGAFTTAFVDIPQSELDDVESLLFGRASISVEAAAPSTSVLLSDWFAEKLTLEPMWDAVQSGDEDAMREAFEAGWSRTPADLYRMSTRLPQEGTGEALTFEDGLRVAAYVQKAQFGTGYEQSLDLFGRSIWATATANPAVAFQRSLERTAYLATAEADLFTTSTKSLLDGLPLRLVNSGSASSDLADLDPTVRARWSELEDPFGLDYYLLVPSTGTPHAFWAVHKGTGTVIGILPDQSGGATRAELEANLEATNKLLDLIGDVGGLFGANVGVWVELEKTKAALVTKATIVIATGEDPGGWGEPLEGLACNAMKEALAPHLPGGSEYFDTVGDLNDALELLGITGVEAPDCP